MAVAADRNGDGGTADEVRNAIVNNTGAKTEGDGAGRIDVLKAVDTLTRPR